MIGEPVVPAAVPEAVAATTDDPAPTTPASVDLPVDENNSVDDAANDNDPADALPATGTE